MQEIRFSDITCPKCHYTGRVDYDPIDQRFICYRCKRTVSTDSILAQTEADEEEKNE